MIPDRDALREELAAAGADGWLLYAFHGLNPVATRILELEGLNTRRLFVLLPAEGEPVAVAHRIELAPVERFPGRVVPYARWEELHAALGRGRGRASVWRWRCSRTTPCRTSTACRAAWWSWCVGWGARWSPRRRW